MSHNVGLEMSLKQIAARARRDRLDPSVYKAARKLTDDQPTISAKVKAIVDRVRLGYGASTTLDMEYVEGPLTSERGRILDADEAVLAAATMCLAVGVRCRVVGARRGHGWTCLLEYQDGAQWVTVDVTGGVPVGADEQVVVECDEAASVVSALVEERCAECGATKAAHESTVSRDGLHYYGAFVGFNDPRPCAKFKAYREISVDDVGKSTIFAFGRYWQASGLIFDVDVGKRVYRASEHVVSVENAEQFKARLESEARGSEATDSNAIKLAKLVYAALTAKLTSVGLGIDLVRPPNPAQGNAVAVLFADGRDVVIRFEESGGR